MEIIIWSLTLKLMSKLTIFKGKIAHISTFLTMARIASLIIINVRYLNLELEVSPSTAEYREFEIS